MSKNEITLYSYWRSSAAYRVRIGLYYKQIPFNYEAICLLPAGGSQQTLPNYAEKNPMCQVPTLKVGNTYLGESLAILEYLEEAYPQNPLLPKDLLQRAKVREIVNIIADDIHPLHNLRVLNKIGQDFKADPIQWTQYWIHHGFKALEKVLLQTAKTYAFGDSITLADCFVVPQYKSALRHGVDLSAYPTIVRVAKEASKTQAFIQASPENQPDKKD